MGHQAARDLSEIPDVSGFRLPPLSSFNGLFGNDLGATIYAQRFASAFRQPQPEVRADFTLRRTSDRPILLTVGAGLSRAEANSRQNLLIHPLSNPNPLAFVPGFGATQVDVDQTIAYAQVSGQVSDRLSLITQLRRQRQRTGTEKNTLAIPILPDFPDQTRSVPGAVKTEYLPSLLATYRAGKSTLVRLFANRRTLGLGEFAFAPTETLITTEGDVLPRSDFFENVDVYELDVERYLPRGFVKLFAFQSTARNVSIGSSLPSIFYRENSGAYAVNLSRVERVGIGARLEHRFGSRLYGNLLFVTNRTTADAPGRPYDGETAPYQPKYRAGIGLDYIDPKGNKLGLFVRRDGGFFEDSPFYYLSNPGADRPRFPARTYVDLRLAKEPSVHNEVFLVVTNVFNRRQISFQDFPVGGRRIAFGVTRRF